MPPSFLFQMSPPLLHLCSSDGAADFTATLPRVQSALDILVRLLHLLASLGKDQLNVARVRHVWVDLYL
jgi:hypothetical protein